MKSEDRLKVEYKNYVIEVDEYNHTVYQLLPGKTRSGRDKVHKKNIGFQINMYDAVMKIIKYEMLASEDVTDLEAYVNRIEAVGTDIREQLENQKTS